jgi:hypothetical protein
VSIGVFIAMSMSYFCGVCFPILLSVSSKVF